MGKLYLMMGIPGSGKSTWCQNHLNNQIVWISRDNIRFSLLKDEDEYFAKEKETFRIFMEHINNFLRKGYDVFADATHLNAAARNKVIRNLYIPADEINVIYFNVPLEVALERNAQRTGRKLVPEAEIKKMYKGLEFPFMEEGINKVYVIEENKPIKIKVLKEV